jgi:tricorn protease
MRRRRLGRWLLVAAVIGWSTLSVASTGGSRLLRFPDVRHDHIVFTYAGDLWTVSTNGGTAVRLTASPGLELFAKYSPDGQHLAFTAQYGGDEQVYVMPAGGGVPQQLTFYPADGPLPERWGSDNEVYGWTPDGSAILFRSQRDAYMLTDSKLYTVPWRGGASTPLPMPVSGAGAFSPDGTRIAYSPLWRDFRNEKRYRGGWANELYIFDLTHPGLTRVTQDPGTDRDPMWIGNAVYFSSDRSGVFNLYRYDIGSGQTRQLTHYAEWDVRWPSADDQQIVYELDGELHLYDTRADVDRTLTITVPADATVTHAQTVNAADNIESATISPGGERVAVVARGDVFSVPVENGVTRNLTHSSTAHDREAAWSSDGKRLAYVSDRSGEEELYVQAQAGTTPARALTATVGLRYSTPRWSADDARIAIADQTGRITVIEVATTHSTVVARDPIDLAHDYRWSPDGRYLSYSLNDAAGYSGVYIWSAADGKSRRVTGENVDSHTPAWAPNGELLYFLSAREYQPMLSTVEFEFATDRQIGVFAVALTKNARNPYGVRDDEPGSNGGKDTDDDPASAKTKTPRPVSIDFDGIVQRAIRVPIEADDLSDLRVTDENLLYQRNGPLYYGRDSSSKPTVMSYSIKDREAKTVIDDVADWSPTADGKHVFALLTSREMKYAEIGTADESKADESKGNEAKSISLAGLITTRVPAEEWHEIFREVWRRYRDFFYVSNMHGYDWEKLRARYEPLVDAVLNRADLNYVMAEMTAELVVQHAYIEGGDLGLPKRPFIALPGARFALDAKSGRYRISQIFAGENEEEVYRSPLTEVGVDVHVGDYVLSINGRELDAGTDPYELLQAPANEPVEWRVAATPDGKNARSIRYRPLASEAPLLYLKWTSANRARVTDMSHGRLGYIHIPDMGEAGLREFIKWWYPQVRKEGLIVDVRDNGGGNISEMLIERLARTVHGTGFSRNAEAPYTYPRVAQSGPKVALINEDTASDGDLFANAFREWKVGKLIGKRTWGGVVGIVDHGPLLDGGTVFVPEYGAADASGHWIIEGHGVDPDIVVDQDPVQVLEGHDPQLERGIAELLEQLPPQPQGLPARPAPPIKTGIP